MIHGWWSRVSTSYLNGDAPLVMISGLQLFWDFFQHTGYEGPWVYRKRWYHQAQEVREQGRLQWGHGIKPFFAFVEALSWLSWR